MKTRYSSFMSVLIVCVFISACSNAAFVTGPSGGGSGSTASTADASTAQAGVSQPSAAPEGWTFVVQGQQHWEFGPFSVFGAWSTNIPGNGPSKAEVEIQIEENNRYISFPILGINHTGVGTTKFQAVMPRGGIYRARMRNAYQDGTFSAWTAYRTVSMPKRVDNPEPVALDINGCIWEFDGELWQLFFPKG